MQQSFQNMEILIISICVLSYVQVSACSALHIPDHFYAIDPNTAMKFNGTGEYVDLQLKSRIPFLGEKMCDNACQDPITLWVSKNGVMEYRRKYRSGNPMWQELTDRPYRMGSVDKSESAIIAPLWAWLSTANGTGTVYYQQTSEPEILNQTQSDVRNNFQCGRRFSPTSALIVTWYNMPFDSCISVAQQNDVNEDEYCDCLGTHDHDFCMESPLVGPDTVTKCKKYSVADYCTCAWSTDDDEKCRCHEHLIYYYGGFEISNYCYCYMYLNEATETCDCYMIGYELEYCRYQTTGVMDYDWCWWRFDDQYLCSCAFDEDMIDHLGGDLAWDVCDCTDNGYRYMHQCICPSTSRAELCSCLTTYEEHLTTPRFTNYVEILDFCECMVNGSGDEVSCGCSDCPLDPAKRELLPKEPMVHEVPALTRKKKMVKREDRPMTSDSAVFDDSVQPWSEDHNTFQVVMATDGRRTYAIYNYESLNVPQYHGNRKHPAVVGFDGYGSSNGFENRFSYKKRLYKLKKKSNVGIKGRWMYRVDNGTVVEPADCM